MQVDVLTIGDALIDTFMGVHEDARYCYFDETKGDICFASGAKIMVESVQFLLGGNASNVGVGLARFGFKSAVAAEIGGDEFAQKILKELKTEGVDLSYIKQTATAESTFSVGITLHNERTLFVHHVEREHDVPIEDCQPTWIYLTSVGHTWEGLYKKATELKKKTNAKLMFNPGSKQLLTGRESFKDQLAIADVLIVNREEAEEIMYGAPQHADSPATAPETLLRALQQLGPKEVCVTDGQKGAWAAHEDGSIYHMGLAPATLVEKTGAGDAFSTGFLAAHMEGKTLQEALEWGSLESASVIEHVGAQKGLLTKQGLQERIKTLREVPNIDTILPAEAKLPNNQ
ncbi:MAG: carbohydrate kinase family protein [Patescibacteria group bacterium]|nr:carbohydrate kinase family protein [Patescibacteria group bacterium]